MIKIQMEDLPANKNPFCNYARILISEGIAETTVLEAYRGEMLCLSSEIGVAAKLSVVEPNDRKGCSRMHWGKYAPFPTEVFN